MVGYKEVGRSRVLGGTLTGATWGVRCSKDTREGARGEVLSTRRKEIEGGKLRVGIKCRGEK